MGRGDEASCSEPITQASGGGNDVLLRVTIDNAGSFYCDVLGIPGRINHIKCDSVHKITTSILFYIVHRHI